MPLQVARLHHLNHGLAQVTTVACQFILKHICLPMTVNWLVHFNPVLVAYKERFLLSP